MTASQLSGFWQLGPVTRADVLYQAGIFHQRLWDTGSPGQQKALEQATPAQLEAVVRISARYLTLLRPAPVGWAECGAAALEAASRIKPVLPGLLKGRK